MTLLDRLSAVARRVTSANRWLLLTVSALLVVATALPPTTGAARGQRLLDLASDPRATAPPAVPRGQETVPPVLAPLRTDLPPAGLAPVTSVPTDALDPAVDESPVGGTSEEPCASAAVIDAVEAAQADIEAGAGQALPIDVAQLFANLVACGPGGNPLDALGVVGQLLEALGIDRIPLPVLPPLPFPPPPPGFDALGPIVLPVCAEVIQQLVTVAALAPFARLDTREVVGLFDPVISVCALFAPVA